MKQIGRQSGWKRAAWHLLMAVCVAVFALGLALVCEAAARQTFDTFRDFIRTGYARVALRNTAILAMLLIGGLYCLTGTISGAMALTGIPLLLVHLINAFKLEFRNEPFYPWDITLAGEATNILSSISLSFSKAKLLAVGYLAAALIVAFLLDLVVVRKIRPGCKVRLAGFALFAAAFGLCFGSWFSKAYIKENSGPVRVYNQTASYLESGFVYAFAANVHHAKIEVPADYSQEGIDGLVAGYESTEGALSPNVIIVMSEAFSDIWNAENLVFGEELAPTFTALAQQYLSGRCMTSEYGGNTANCEFEVLTGYSTYLLPSGTVPYMSYLNQNTDSYVSFLNGRGYYTVALHPYRRSFFSREKAFELLGFRDYYSEEHFEGAERLRAMKYVSDDALAERIIAEYEHNRTTGQGFFCHTVTMQNHTSYYASDWSEEQRVGMEVLCELTEAERDSIQSYATGIRYADAMLETLVDYFSLVEEPTVLLFFGDHQPSLGSPGYELMQRIGYVSDNTTPEGKLLLQSTPYLIWNNFEEVPTQAVADMSMFHLLPYMTRMLNMDRPAFHSYMDDLYGQLRGVTRQVSLDGAGIPCAALPEQNKVLFDRYLKLVYDGLIGRQYGNETLFPEAE